MSEYTAHQTRTITDISFIMTNSSACSLDDKRRAHAYIGDQRTWRVKVEGKGGMCTHRSADCASPSCIVTVGAGELGDDASEQRPSEPDEPPDEPYEEKRDPADVQADPGSKSPDELNGSIALESADAWD